MTPARTAATPDRPHRCRSTWLAAGLTLALAGCIVVPSTRETYDPQCKVLKREMTLEVATAVPRLRSCGGDECAALMAAAGIVTAASAVVSGSIAVVGNALFWLERQGKCAADAGVTPVAPAAPAASGSASRGAG